MSNRQKGLSEKELSDADLGSITGAGRRRNRRIRRQRNQIERTEEPTRETPATRVTTPDPRDQRIADLKRP